MFFTFVSLLPEGTFGQEKTIQETKGKCIKIEKDIFIHYYYIIKNIIFILVRAPKM